MLNREDILSGVLLIVISLPAVIAASVGVITDCISLCAQNGQEFLDLIIEEENYCFESGSVCTG